MPGLFVVVESVVREESFGTHNCLRVIHSSLDQRAAASLITALADFEDDMRGCAGRFTGKEPGAPDAADLGHRALGAPVLLADPENHGIDEREGVIEHQPLDFAIGRAAPMAAGDEGPADLDFASPGVITIIAA